MQENNLLDAVNTIQLSRVSRIHQTLRIAPVSDCLASRTSQPPELHLSFESFVYVSRMLQST